MTTQPGGPLEPLRRRQRALWVAAVALYGVGDTVTTVGGLQAGGVVEAGPVAASFVAASGVPGLLALKGLFFAGTFALWSAVDSEGRVAIPLALAVVGAFVTCWNLAVLAPV